jgi:hypothetical protein
MNDRKLCTSESLRDGWSITITYSLPVSFPSQSKQNLDDNQ